MPYDVRKTDKCPASKPWGVFKIDGEELIACHVSKDKGQAQIEAIHATDGKAYTPDEIRAMKERIIAAWKEKIDKSGPPMMAEKSADVLAAEPKAEAQAKAERQAAIDEEIARFHRNLRRYQ